MFGQRLQASRKNTGMTGKVVARLIGVSYSAYTKYESNLRMPDIITLGKLADLFHVTTDYLLGRTDSSEIVNGPTPEDQPIAYINFQGDRAVISPEDAALAKLREDPALTLRIQEVSQEVARSVFHEERQQNNSN